MKIKQVSLWIKDRVGGAKMGGDRDGQELRGQVHLTEDAQDGR